MIFLVFQFCQIYKPSKAAERRSIGRSLPSSTTQTAASSNSSTPSPKMCGYHELQTPCCGEKIGFSPSSSHKCSHYYTNNRYCRTGSIHSWILPTPPLTTSTKCESCKQDENHEQAVLQAEIKRREKQMEKEREEQEERRQQEQARELRLWDKEMRRVKEERGKGNAVEALRSQIAGLKVKDGEDVRSSGGK